MENVSSVIIHSFIIKKKKSSYVLKWKAHCHKQKFDPINFLDMGKVKVQRIDKMPVSFKVQLIIWFSFSIVYCAFNLIKQK